MPGTPTGSRARDTHAVAFLPLVTGSAGQATLTLPSLQERGDVGDEMGARVLTCPHVLTCAHSSRAEMLQAQPRVCKDTSLLELGSVCPGGDKPTFGPGGPSVT